MESNTESAVYSRRLSGIRLTPQTAQLERFYFCYYIIVFVCREVVILNEMNDVG